jgi:ribosomal silencing factor RsfS
MSTGILSKAIAHLVEEQSDKRAEDFAVVNVRPGEKVSAMLDVIAHIFQKTPATLIADALSQKLESYAGSSPVHAEAILNAAGQVIAARGVLSSSSALGLLQERGLVNVTNPFMRDIDLSACAPLQRDA